MHPSSFLLTAFTCLLVACGGKKSTVDNNNNTKINQLVQTDIFNKDAVNKYLISADKNQQQPAKKEFLIGVDQYRNRKQIDSAITTFKNSICIYPFAKSYYELGNAYMDKKDFKTAIESYKMAETMSYEPISLVLYNQCCAYSMMGDGDNAIKYIQLAIENGYTNLEHIMSDTDLDFVRMDDRFSETVKTAMAGNTSSDAVLFTMYKTHFEQISFPYMITEEKSQLLDFDKTISYDYDDFVPGMVNAEFSRDVGDEYFYVGKVMENEGFVALLYSQAGMWAEKPPVHTYLATYDAVKGKLIDFEKVGGMEYYSDSLRTAVVKEDMSVEVKYFVQEWEKDPDEYGYDAGNKRTALNLAATRNFKIDEKGNIREIQKMIGQLRR
jgi:tetratricopeptide (TPR) repeat protein